MMKKTVALTFMGLAIAGVASAQYTTNLVITWENTWAWSGGGTGNSVASQTPLASGVATNLNKDWSYLTAGACNDGTFGSSTLFEANTNTGNNADGWISQTDAAPAIDFHISNDGGAMALQSFHFDAIGNGDDAPDAWMLEVISGSISTGVVASGALAGGAGPDLADYDVSLTNLADSVLDLGGDIVFRLTFSGGGDTNAPAFFTYIDNVALIGLVPESSLEMLVGWGEGWDATSNENDLSGDYTGIATFLSAGTNGWTRGINAACTDGSWGSVSNPAASVSTNLVTDGIFLANGNNGTMDFSITDTTGEPTDLGAFHFDYARFRWNSAETWTLEVLDGSSISTGLVKTAGVGVYNTDSNLPDIDVNLTGLADSELDAFGTATFRLTFSNGEADKPGHHGYLDNVGVSKIVIGDIPVDLDSVITAYAFDPAGTSSLSFAGGPSSEYVIKATDSLTAGGYTTVTPSAVTQGSLVGDVITTDAAGKALAEFTDSAPSKFYKIESAP